LQVTQQYQTDELAQLAREMKCGWRGNLHIPTYCMRTCLKEMVVWQR
jgi:hypothetical protein